MKIIEKIKDWFFNPVGKCFYFKGDDSRPDYYVFITEKRNFASCCKVFLENGELVCNNLMPNKFLTRENLIECTPPND